MNIIFDGKQTYMQTGMSYPSHVDECDQPAV